MKTEKEFKPREINLPELFLDEELEPAVFEDFFPLGSYVRHETEYERPDNILGY